jgi:hypothetical protein
MDEAMWPLRDESWPCRDEMIQVTHPPPRGLVLGDADARCVTADTSDSLRRAVEPEVYPFSIRTDQNGQFKSVCVGPLEMP